MNNFYIKTYTDDNGYLINLQDWNKSIALKIAKRENLLLSNDHWKVIYLLRKFYIKYKILPAIRVIISLLIKENKKRYWNSIYLFTLFPNGIFVQAIKIAGLPKPDKCL